VEEWEKSGITPSPYGSGWGKKVFSARACPKSTAAWRRLSLLADVRRMIQTRHGSPPAHSDVVGAIHHFLRHQRTQRKTFRPACRRHGLGLH